MRICYVLISMGWGGAEYVVYELIKNMKNHDKHISLIINQEIIEYFSDINGLMLINIGNLYNNYELFLSILFPKRIPKTNQKLSNSSISIFVNEILRLIYFCRIKGYLNEVLKEQQIEIIHSHLKNSDILVYFLKNKFKWFSTIHGMPIISFLSENKKFKLLNRLNRRILKNSIFRINHIIFVSKFLQKTFNNEAKVDICFKSSVIYNGIDLANLKKEIYDNVLDQYAGFKMLFPGGAKPSKGGDILIPALVGIKEEIKDFHLFIALDVPKDHLMRKIVDNYNLQNKVHFLGFLEKKEYYKILKSVDILVMPSRREGFSIAQLEAMAFGKPIIAGRTGGTPELIKNHHNGILIDLNSEQISKSIVELYENQKLRNKISKNNLSDVEKFDWKIIVQDYINLYKESLIDD